MDAFRSILSAFLMDVGNGLEWLALYSVIFIPLTLCFPNQPRQPLYRRDLPTDVAFFLISPVYGLIQTVLQIFILTGITSFSAFGILSQEGKGTLSSWPLWLQVIVILVVTDFLQYWTHRISHMRYLWKLHSIHHSSKQVDWMSSMRWHPINFLYHITLIQALVWSCGFSVEAFPLVLTITGLNSLLVHANINWTYGFLGNVFASPIYHRWHHTKPSQGGDKNFAPFFSVFDLIFGTYYLPKGEIPTDFGAPYDAVPDHLWGQLMYPFRRAKKKTQTGEEPSTEKSTFGLAVWHRLSNGHKIIVFLLAANFLFGAAVVLILPPFEGWNETMHLSRLEAYDFLQDTSPAQHGILDALDLQVHPVSAYVFDYYHNGPMPYTWIEFELNHIEDTNGVYLTYDDFFNQPGHQEDYRAAYWQSPLPAVYQPSPQENREYQHPPLYYLLLAPLLSLMAGHASLITVMLMLRLVSTSMAFAGLTIGVTSTLAYLRRTVPAEAETLMALGLLYPFLMPEYFWEFGRIGNDSLCLLLFGAAWAMLLRHIENPNGKAWLPLVIFLALGWFAKALMIPISAGIFAFLAYHHFFKLRKDQRFNQSWWRPLAKIASLSVVCGVPLGLMSLTYSNGGAGGKEFSEALAGGNLYNLIQSRFSWDIFWISLKGMIYTFVWIFGSWSAVIIALPFVFYKTYCFVIGGIAALMSRRHLGVLFTLPFFLIVPVFAGLLLHIVATILIAATPAETRDTPGFYFHILAPVFVLIYGSGMKLLFDSKMTRIAALVLVALMVAFNYFILWSSMSLFAGCAVPLGHFQPVHLLQLSDIAACATSFDVVIARLSLVAWPVGAIGCLSGAAVLLGAAGTLLLRDQRCALDPNGKKPA